MEEEEAAVVVTEVVEVVTEEVVEEVFISENIRFSFYNLNISHYFSSFVMDS